MCEFCTLHGEGKKWYENMVNYSEAMFHRVNSEGNLRRFLSGFRRSLEEGTARAGKWQRRMPRLYRLLIAPRLTRYLKKTHFGQIVPLEDAEGILARVGSIIRLPCICRRVTTGREHRYCLAVGMDLAAVFREEPDFRNFERLEATEAIGMLRRLDTEGMTHSVWTFNTPFIGALCNCDQNCMAYRFQHRMGLGRVMWKGECAAVIEDEACSGCRECLGRCYYGAVRFDRQRGRCRVVQELCSGCGLCRTVCENGAIRLVERSVVSAIADSW
ncbi:MAG: 4Fe-4S binding protein [Deltaproteobacteria bacterium]